MEIWGIFLRKHSIDIISFGQSSIYSICYIGVYKKDFVKSVIKHYSVKKLWFHLSILKFGIISWNNDGRRSMHTSRYWKDFLKPFMYACMFMYAVEYSFTSLTISIWYLVKNKTMGKYIEIFRAHQILS